MRTHRPLVSFDWALKRLLRSKANFVVLEGFLSELLKIDIEILEVLESSSVKDKREEKMNIVDLKVKTKRDEIMIIEVQYDRDYSFFHRILYSTSRIVSEHLSMGEMYKNIKKVISVNLLYFDLGEGEDYIYHGTTTFKGIHFDDTLSLQPKYIKGTSYAEIKDIFPEYYLIKINQFNNVAKDTLDEWIYFLKNEKIESNFSAKGLKEAEEVLQYLKLSPEEQAEFNEYLDISRTNDGLMQTKFEEGLAEGKAEGLAEGKAEGLAEGKAEGLAEGEAKGLEKGKLEERKAIVSAMIKQGMSHAVIASILEISESDVQKLMELN